MAVIRLLRSYLIFLLLDWMRGWVSAATLSRSEDAVRANQESARKFANYYANAAHEEADHRCLQSTFAKQQQCAQPIYEHAREQQRREYEIEADRNSAVWTQAMGYAGVYGEPLGAFTAILLFYAFVLQSVANRQARQEFAHSRKEAAAAALASERAFRHADVTARARLRCYINSIAEKYEPDETGTKGSLTYIFKNVGLTPAHDLICETRTTLTRRNPDDGPPRKVTDYVTPYGLVGPGAELALVYGFTIAAEEARAIELGTAILRDLVVITYRDELGDRWQFTQDMQADRSSLESKIMYTNSCSTRRITDAEAQENDDMLPLEGGGEGRAEEA